MEVSDEAKRDAIREYVRDQRERGGIHDSVLSTKPLPEGSCEMMGEFRNLVDRQLIMTREGYGDWASLRFQELLDGAYEYVLKAREPTARAAT